MTSSFFYFFKNFVRNKKIPKFEKNLERGSYEFVGPRAGACLWSHQSLTTVDNDLDAIILYTLPNGVYDRCNYCMRNKILSEIELFRPFIFHLYSALQKLPAYTGDVFRVLRTAIDPTLYIAGETVVWTQFSSTSCQLPLAVSGFGTSGGTLFLISGHTCRRISALSMVCNEDEALFSFDARFKVVGSMDWNAKMNLAQLYKADQINNMTVIMLQEHGDERHMVEGHFALSQRKRLEERVAECPFDVSGRLGCPI